MNQDACKHCGAAWMEPQPSLAYFPCQTPRDGLPSALCESRQAQNSMLTVIDERDQWKAEAARLEAALEDKTREIKILRLRLAEAEAKSKGPFWRWIAQDALNNECYTLRELKKQDERLEAALLEIKNLKESTK